MNGMRDWPRGDPLNDEVVVFVLLLCAAILNPPLIAQTFVILL